MNANREQRRRIVIVDDDPDLRDTVREWLAPSYDVVCLEHGEELLADLDALAPDFIILDVDLPGPDGVRLCRRLRADRRFAGIPIIFLSGIRSSEVFLKGLEMGGDAFLHKPIGRERLLRTIRDVFEGTGLTSTG